MHLIGTAQNLNPVGSGSTTTTELATAQAPAKLTVAVGPSLSEFLLLLFETLEKEDLRYCVLHGWERLPIELDPDGNLDLAIHPDDAEKLPSVVRALSERGYQPIQRLNYAGNAYALVFAWFEDLALKTVTADFTFEPPNSGFIGRSGEAPAVGRQKLNGLWIAEPTTEFAFLLVKKLSKGRVGSGTEQRLRLLVERLGRPKAEQVASTLFGKMRGGEIVQACEDLTLGEILEKLRPVPLRRHIFGRPLNAIRSFFEDAVRLVRRWRRPPGFSLILLGPDGVGKSTLVAGLLQAFAPVFRHHQIFHWRPGVAVPIRDGDGSLSNPHGQAPRGVSMSVLYLFGFFLDFCVGYAVRIRPSLIRSGLVIFDRYLPDLLVDQRRYRYAGPLWLVRLLLRLVPGFGGLLLVLDAPEEVILSRKHQLSPRELQRQRADYRLLSCNLPNAHLLETQHGVEQTLAMASQIIVQHLAERFHKQHMSCVALNPRPAAAGSR